MLKLWPLSLLLFFAGCYEPVKGCLDLTATNFDANADEDCCCKYPELQLSISQSYGGQAYKEGDIYKDVDGGLFKLNSVTFYLSGFEVLQTGRSYSVADTIGLWTQPAGTSAPVRRLFTDDFLLVRRTSVTNALGVFRHEGTFDGLRMRLGLADSVLSVLPARAPSGHPLATQSDSIWRSPQGFVFMQIVVHRDTFSTTAPDTLSFFSKDLPDCIIEGKGLSVSKELGKNVIFTLTADYAQLLKNISWTTGDKTAWKRQILSNIKGSFSVN